jgi:hypothetical protein
VHGVSDVRQMRHIYIDIAELRRYKLPGSHQIIGELIQIEGQILLFEINKLNNSVWNKKELPDQWKESYYFTNLRKG